MSEDSNYMNLLNSIRERCFNLQLVSHQEITKKNGRPGDIVITYMNMLKSYFTCIKPRLESPSERKQIENKMNGLDEVVRKVNNSRRPATERNRSKGLIKRLDKIFTDILQLEAHYGFDFGDE